MGPSAALSALHSAEPRLWAVHGVMVPCAAGRRGPLRGATRTGAHYRTGSARTHLGAGGCTACAASAARASAGEVRGANGGVGRIRSDVYMEALVGLPPGAWRAGLEVLGSDLGRRNIAGGAGDVLEPAGICADPGLRHDGDRGACDAEPSLPHCSRDDWEGAAGTRGTNQRRRRDPGARRDDFRRDMDGRADASARGRMAGHAATWRRRARRASCDSWGARAM